MLALATLRFILVVFFVSFDTQDDLVNLKGYLGKTPSVKHGCQKWVSHHSISSCEKCFRILDHKSLPTRSSIQIMYCTKRTLEMCLSYLCAVIKKKSIKFKGCRQLNHEYNTVWPQPIWKKVRSSSQIPPQHQSTYLGGQESASIEIPPFRPKFT